MASVARGPRAGHIRGFRSEDAKAQVAQRAVALELLFARPADLQRALREARRAGQGGAGHYDPARHAALVRLLKRRGKAPPRRASAEPGENGAALAPACPR